MGTIPWWKADCQQSNRPERKCPCPTAVGLPGSGALSAQTGEKDAILIGQAVIQLFDLECLLPLALVRRNDVSWSAPSCLHSLFLRPSPYGTRRRSRRRRRHFWVLRFWRRRHAIILTSRVWLGSPPTTYATARQSHQPGFTGTKLVPWKQASTVRHGQGTSMRWIQQGFCTQPQGLCHHPTRRDSPLCCLEEGLVPIVPRSNVNASIVAMELAAKGDQDSLLILTPLPRPLPAHILRQICHCLAKSSKQLRAPI